MDPKTTGKLNDIEYRKVSVRYELPAEGVDDGDVENFPIEKARLYSIRYTLAVCCALIAAYGWTLWYQVVSQPLVCMYEFPTHDTNAD